ncbi:MAG TPA: TetR/AcrR family transcriptional regulator [Candidatus Corynebacterium avicola]|uniref:TetR/AcrR family transcriptional regulator n=1 Tax=Candidatus Corynebacterium avicola TaxID=2838527 RepID=A0A9D1ULE3_9CORY|nr:TetR/AcrR family transcriptional regulator [Candidatus Corynebacterium avicola]
MGKHGDKAREKLMDAAEELFARHGIDAVSNRTIAEHAGTANHSAVGYHFGNREKLLVDLVTRDNAYLRARRQELREQLPDTPPLQDIVAAHVLPWFEKLAAQPVPGWRARFLRQVASTPSVRESLRANQGTPRPDQGDLRLADALSGEHPALEDVPEQTLGNRCRLVEGMVLDIAAAYEQQAAAGTARGDWFSAGYFLIDAASGMLSAPVTHPTDFLASPSPSVLSL